MISGVKFVECILEGAFCDKQLSGYCLMNVGTNVMSEELKLIFHLRYSLMKKWGVIFMCEL